MLEVTEPISVKILFIEDSKNDVAIMLRAIERVGYKVIWSRIETEAALLLSLHKERWDFIVCDFLLPAFTCDKALKIVKMLRPEIPFLIVSGAVKEEAALALVDEGAIDFISKDRTYRIPLAIKRELRNVDMQTKQRLQLEQSFNAIVLAWGQALDLRDHSTQGHTLRVTNHAVVIATRNNASPEVLKNVYFGSLLHDIGKMGIPDIILNKDGKLTAEEWEIMKRHPIIARRFLEDIPFLKEASVIPYCHHERWDGSGYPQGLVGDQIPVCARIFALADVYDALTHDRPYRKALNKVNAIGVMRNMKPQFDPELFKDFMENEGAFLDVDI